MKQKKRSAKISKRENPHQSLESEMIKTALSYIQRNRSIFFVGLLVALGLAVYANSLGNELFWDDFDSIVHNAYLRDWNYFPRFFSENLTAGSGILSNYWRPLLLISFSIDFRISELSPWMYHLQNIFWHIASATLVFFVFRKIFQTNLKTSPETSEITAFLMSVLFLIHPVQVEAVTYVAGRADPMHAAFLLGSFLLFLQYIEKNRKIAYIIASIVLFVLSLLTKERAIVFPFILGAYLFTLTPKNFLRSFGDKIKIIIPYLLVCSLYVFARLTVLDFSNVFDFDQPNNIGAHGIYQHILAYLQAIGHYASLLVWPNALFMERTLSTPSGFFDTFSVPLGFIILVSAIVAMLISFRKRRLFVFGMGWFLISIAPSIHIYPIQGILYEHWLYLPIIGLLFALGSFCGEQWHKPQNRKNVRLIFFVLFTFIALMFAVRTIYRNADWRNPTIFYEKNIRLGGESARVWTNLGIAYDDKGRHTDAVKAYQKAVGLEPLLWVPWFDLGNALYDLQKWDESEKAYRKALELNPSFIPSYHKTALILLEDKKTSEAVSVLRLALEKDPQNSQTNALLGSIELQNGNKKSARDYFQRALQFDPKNPQLLHILNEL